MIEITIKTGETMVTILVDGDQVSVKQPEQTKPVNLDQDFMLPVDRAANVNEDFAGVIEKRNDEFVKQFAAELAESPTVSAVIPSLGTDDVLAAIDTVAEEADDE